MIDRVVTPVNVLSSRLQWVTQWMSHTTSIVGMARNLVVRQLVRLVDQPEDAQFARTGRAG
jgi:hypothetical protein